jgi:hypothetical protein
MAVAALLLRLTRDRAATALGALLFLVLPTTVAVHLFITARHYMEGLLFLLLAMLLAERGWVWAALLACALAALYKETYAATALVFLLAHGLVRREWRLAGGAIAIGALYFLYRFWVLGLDVGYSERPLAASEIGQFLHGLAYSITAGESGLLLAIGALLLAGAGLARRAARTPATIALLVAGVALFSIVPVATAIVQTYQTPGTWYRVPFTLDALAVIGLAWGAARLLPRPVALVVLALAVAVTLPGTVQTRQHWDARMAAAEREGRFYLANPDKLLYSEEQAWWFIRGVHELYGVGQIHYLNASRPTDELTRPALARSATIWRYRDSAFGPDDALLRELRSQNNLP